MLRIKDIELLEEDCNIYFSDYAIKLNRNELVNALRDVYRWQYSDGSSFSSKLIDLIAKADENNKAKLMKVYPKAVVAYILWFWKDAFNVNYKNDDDFFDYMCDKLRTNI